MSKKQDVIQEYTKKDGSKAYMFQLYLGTDPMTGKQKRTTRRGFSSRKEALLARSRLMVEVEENGLEQQKKMLFKDVYELWFNSAYKNTVKESTYVKTQEMFRNHILPAFGSYRVDKITIKYCQVTVNEWCEKLAKYRMLKNYVTKVLDYAITIETLKSNPMRKITMPKRKEVIDEEKEENFYSKEELKTFLKHVENDFYIKWYAIFRTLAFTGFRKGELLALQWKDINFEESTITVSKALARGENNRLIIQSPKNKSSARTISVDQVTMDVLKKWRKQQAIDMLKFGFNTMNQTQAVFTTLENKHIQPANTTNRINQIINSHKLKRITVHGLRHTHCSLLFESGAPLEVVKERLGHSDIKTTMNIYTHVTKASIEKTADQFAKYVNF